MPRRFSLSFVAAVAALVVLVAPVSAVVVLEGSVNPAPPSGTFGNPPIGLADENGDLVADWIDIGGNQVFTTGTLAAAPTGIVGGQVVAVPWNDESLWVDYDSEQHILVGDAFSNGSLTINGGSDLRYQHLVIGHASSESPFQTSLEFSTLENPMSFRLQDDLALQGIAGSGGSGTVIVTGPGSTFNNDPNVIPREFQTDINAALGERLDRAFYELEPELAATVFNPAPTFSTREDDIGFDVVVGASGSGRLQVDNGGRVEIQDALMVAVSRSSFGDVIVDGFGSTLTAFGRTQFRDQIVVDAEIDEVSFIGGRGAGSMTIRNFGTAEFRNGLSIGAPINVFNTSVTEGEGQGSGTVQVTGFGSRLVAYASAVTGFDVPGTSDDLALAIGELRSSGLDTPNTDTNLQPGTLEIADGATVLAISADSYGTDEDDENVAVGPAGQVLMRNGELIVGNLLSHDGDLNGYGLVRARELETSGNSVIAGGDPAALNQTPADPLRVVLVGPATDPMGPGVVGVQTALTHRGVIEGQVDFEITGGVLNSGAIQASGEINATAITSSATSRIEGVESGGEPLRLRLSSTTSLTGGLATMNEFGPAFQNNGLLAGSIDLVTAGGFANGEDQTSGVAPASSNSGTIRVDGRLQVGTFINHRFGEVIVDPGATTSLIATSTTPEMLPGVVMDSGTPSSFVMANLGSVTVNGGTFEAALLQDDLPPGGGGIDPTRAFRNARAAGMSGAPEDASVGTIVSNNGDLRFGEGVINNGVMAFTGGANVVSGQVLNSEPVDDGSGMFVPGLIQTSGDGTTVTFVDHVVNDGTISIGPNDNEVVFLNGVSTSGPSFIMLSENVTNLGISDSAYITVAGEAELMGGGLGLEFTTVPLASALTGGTSLTVINADTLSAGSRFTALDLPLLGAGLFWDVVYDTAAGDVRLEIIASAAVGADFDGNGIVDDADVDIWLANVGITTGASIIQGDADGDGDVDLFDFDILQDQLGGAPTPVPGIAVPEPAAALLLALAAASATTCRRRG